MSALRMYEMSDGGRGGISSWNRGGNHFIVAAVSYRQALYLAYNDVWDSFGPGPGIVALIDRHHAVHLEDGPTGCDCGLFVWPKHLGPAGPYRARLRAWKEAA
jgi:hypothetical protein